LDFAGGSGSSILGWHFESFKSTTDAYRWLRGCHLGPSPQFKIDIAGFVGNSAGFHG
jgi:hypothetical protein